MTETHKKLIGLIRGVIGKGNGKIEIIDWEALFDVARVHSVMPMLYYALKRGIINPPPEYVNLINAVFFDCVTLQCNQQHYANAVYDAMDKKGIRYMPIKGDLICSVYPEKEMRNSCDVDLFYDRERTPDIDVIMSEFGFELYDKGNSHDMYKKGDITFEFHHDLTTTNNFLTAYYENVWDRLIHVSGSRYMFSTEDNYIFIMLHFIKHFFSAGGGIRQILDIFMYNNKYKAMDRKYLCAEFEKLGILKFADVMERAAYTMFGDENPDNDVSEIIDYITEGTVYGFENISAIIKFGGKKFGNTSMRYLIYHFFLPYSKMRSRYPILKKAPFLLPVFWCIRWGEIIFFRRECIGYVFGVAEKTSNDKNYNHILEVVGLNEHTEKYW